MTERIEFGSKAAADAAREEHAEHLCSDDDRRLKTVAFTSDTPDHVLEEATVEAAAGRTERDGTGQVELTDGERDRIDFTETNVPHARSVKAIAADEGVDDWTAYYDVQLTVDEHRDVMERAAREGGGRRMDNDDTTDERLARTEEAVGGRCDHARDHCEHGDPEACEFLEEACGFDEERIEEILGDDEEMPGEIYGAVRKLWTRYQIGIADAKEAAAAINQLNEQYGEPLETFEELGDRELTIDDVDWQEGAA